MRRLYVILLLLSTTLLAIMFALFIILVNLPIKEYSRVSLNPSVKASLLSSVYQVREIPVCHTSSVKTYMDYRMITSKTSDQYQYIHNSGKVIKRDGFLWDGEFKAVALGSYFGPIGSKYIFTLSTGTELKVVKADAKADAHTYGGCQQRWDTSVIEFVIDSRAFKKEANGYVKNGNFNNDPAYEGSIIKIEEVVE